MDGALGGVDTGPLDAAVDAEADRLRRLPESRLRRGAAAGALAVARRLAERAQLLERPGRVPRELPDAGIYSVGDQLAVAGHDLSQAIRESTDGAAAERELTAALELLRRR
ncbi:hypothetical protein [Streptomyces sp. SBT349]|uniref:hypothetical protein n=1 Tax=Streptomyces sp. SBT349 TaxID=1580539 RepID=UPI00066A354F|nr:hypothetical protein [Streptomyces sp. SBT349]